MHWANPSKYEIHPSNPDSTVEATACTRTCHVESLYKYCTEHNTQYTVEDIMTAEVSDPDYGSLHIYATV